MSPDTMKTKTRNYLSKVFPAAYKNAVSMYYVKKSSQQGRHTFIDPPGQCPYSLTEVRVCCEDISFLQSIAMHWSCHA